MDKFRSLLFAACRPFPGFCPSEAARSRTARRRGSWNIFLPLLLAGGLPTAALGAGSVQCAACQPGTFTNVGTEASCTKCPVGYYCPGASNKIPCPGGLTAPPGAASRRECRGYIPAEGYTANKNQCVVNSPAGNTACYSGTLTTVNGNTYTYAVSSNSLGIIDSTWACSSDQASGQPMTKANMAQLTMGTYCWCGYKKASGWSSSWAFAIELNSAPNCAYNCPWYCAYYASMGTVGSAVSW